MSIFAPQATTHRVGAEDPKHSIQPDSVMEE